VVMIAASLPVFCLLQMLGGFTLAQILWLEAVCLATAFAAASWGSLVAFWRDKTFQTLAITVLGAVLFLGAVEVLGASFPRAAEYVYWLNPYRVLVSLLNPLSDPTVFAPRITAVGPVAALGGLGVILSTVTTLRLRKWNPSKSVHAHALTHAEAQERAYHRQVWDSPIIWREMRTRAYGRKIFFIKLAYFVLAGLAAFSLYHARPDSGLVLDMIPASGFAFVGLALVALLLVNAQAVTALTSERDGQTLELLLATDVTAREFVFGKLGGVLYNTWQVIIVPLLFVLSFLIQGELTLENSIYVVLGFLTLVAFSATLGLHSGLTYDNSRAAIANSMGTVFFLFIGIFVCLMLIVEARSSYAIQLPQFLLFIVGGSLGLWLSLTHRNPSPALKLAAFTLPFFTFHALTSFLLQGSLGVCIVIVAAYGFTTVAMLVPAVSEFDVALGRSTLDQG
jgi:ABC-type transport system involved in multi-copper enzyme maturation permease subunit